MLTIFKRLSDAVFAADVCHANMILFEMQNKKSFQIILII